MLYISKLEKNYFLHKAKPTKTTDCQLKSPFRFVHYIPKRTSALVQFYHLFYKSITLKIYNAYIQLIVIFYF